MSSIMIFAKRSGVLVACRPFPAPDGCTWQCGVCGFHPVIRASFGVMNGMWRCQCGAELELMIDGKSVSIQEVAQEMPVEVANVPAKPKRKRTRKLKDVDFLRECGIANPEESK